MLTIVDFELRVRENEGKYQVISINRYSDNSVKRVVLCTRDTLEEAIKVMRRSIIK